MKGKWLKTTFIVLISLILILGAALAFDIHQFNQSSQKLRWHTIQHFQFAYRYMNDYQKTHQQQDLDMASRELAKASEVIFAYAVVYDPDLRNFSLEQLDVLADGMTDPEQIESVKNYMDIIMNHLNIKSNKNEEMLGHNRKYFEMTLLKASKALPYPLAFNNN